MIQRYRRSRDDPKPPDRSREVFEAVARAKQVAKRGEAGAAALHPGEWVSLMLNTRGWTQGDLAVIMDRPISLVNRIVRGRCRITPRTASELGAAFGCDAMYWLRLQNQYWLAGRQK